jgi:hypothetical protein
MKAAPLAAILALTSQFCPASDWLQFRGPLSSGNAPRRKSRPLMESTPPRTRSLLPSHRR